MSSPSSFDPADIKGNLTDPQKRTAAKIFQHFIGTPDTSFGAEIGRNLRIVEITVADTRDGGIYPEGWAGDDEGYSWIEDEGAYRSFGSKGKNDEKRMPSKISAKDAIARTVCEIDVTRNMCNVYGTLHGGCAAYMIDPCVHLPNAFLSEDMPQMGDRCSVSALVTLGIVAGIDGTGVSQSMVLQWHRPATM
ncbi:hypothetical protein V5O48_000525 [Marasmius crinis-equi]|uniref:Uncharacterized protein n=1 Tax=Marasmius crinis-equi TaxID=585013 RepID=A0ABR3G118_9AGAR